MTIKNAIKYLCIGTFLFITIFSNTIHILELISKHDFSHLTIYVSAIALLLGWIGFFMVKIELLRKCVVNKDGMDKKAH